MAKPMAKGMEKSVAKTVAKTMEKDARAGQRLPVLCLAGPTGAGKTALAIRLAEELDGEIVNADSRQVYADFPILTAQPDQSELEAAPHHLYGFLATGEPMDVQKWMALAVARARDIAARGKLPLFVGGTGMYFERLLHGIAQVPAIPRELHDRLEERADREGSPTLHRELQNLDPELALRLHPNDRQRIVRGLEVALGTDRPLTRWHREAHALVLCEGALLVVDTALAALEPRLAARIDAMLARGAVEEARKAWKRCPNRKAPGWSGIGCREMCQFLQGDLTLEEARELWVKNTRAYAKRQITWFRGRAGTSWIGADDLAGALEAHKAFWSGKEDGSVQRQLVPATERNIP